MQSKVTISRKTRRWMVTYSGPDGRFVHYYLNTRSVRIRISARSTTAQVIAHFRKLNPWYESVVAA